MLKILAPVGVFYLGMNGANVRGFAGGSSGGYKKQLETRQRKIKNARKAQTSGRV